MFLCAYDGKLHDNEDIEKETIFTPAADYANTSKDYKCVTCSQCWGLINIKYQLDNENRFIVPLNEKLKLFRISSYNIDNLIEKEKQVDNNKKLITDILKVMKTNEKKNIKKGNKC